MHVAAIIAAGGRGLRLGAGQPKQFLDLGGRSILDVSIDALLDSGCIGEVVVAVPGEYLSTTTQAWRGRSSAPVIVVEGGARRQDSVAQAFARVSPHADLIAVHDAARPFVTRDVIDRAVGAAARHGAAIAALPVHDTVKQAGVSMADGSRVIRGTLPRHDLYLAQTPQVFRRDIFTQALAGGDADATDEAALVERAGYTVHLVDGDPANVKITTAADLAAARARWADRAGAGGPMVRIGTGYDLHRLVAGRPLILGGVRVPCDLGLDGHSDADIVCHAVTDAVLGAVAAGDIGRLFPDTDPAWKDADSVGLLREATRRVAARGYRVVNVDVSVIAQRPRLAPYVDAMRQCLAGALSVDAAHVSVKAKTNEGVDSMGRGESMACHAVALLARL